MTYNFLKKVPDEVLLEELYKRPIWTKIFKEISDMAVECEKLREAEDASNWNAPMAL